jgi:hypothetical protein
MSERKSLVKTDRSVSGFYQNGYRVSMFRERRATSIENDALRLTVLHEGGHVAEIRDKQTGINPLWIPPWPSIEPSAYHAARHPEYGGGTDASLLAGIMGHNLCLDIFGGPSPDEAAASLPVHGEVSTARFAVDANADEIAMNALLPAAPLRIERRIVLTDRAVRVHESVENLGRLPRVCREAPRICARIRRRPDRAPSPRISWTRRRTRHSSWHFHVPPRSRSATLAPRRLSLVGRHVDQARTVRHRLVLLLGQHLPALPSRLPAVLCE